MSKRTQKILIAIAAAVIAVVVIVLVAQAATKKPFDAATCKTAAVGTIQKELLAATSMDDFNKRLKALQDSDGKIHLEQCEGDASEETKKKVLDQVGVEITPLVTARALEWAFKK